MKITLQLGGVPKKINKIAHNEKVGIFLATTCARYMDQYVPYRKGALAGSVKTDVPFEVSYNTPYARRIFYGEGITIHGDEHPDATKKWHENLEPHKKQIASETTNYIKRL